jgi:hypothetical protein
MTRYSTPSWFPTSWTVQMCGWESCEIALASLSNRWRNAGFSERLAGRTFTATVRSSRVSRAL